MMPVQRITIRRTLSDGTRVEHQKPLYLCEDCLSPASYGFTTIVNNHRVRKWFCKSHLPLPKERNVA